MSTLFMGVDAGGTRTRAVLATQAGEIVGVGRADGANPWSSGTPVAAVVSRSMRVALGERDPGAVAAGVIAVPGGADTSPQIAPSLREAWDAHGFDGSPHLVPDVLVAFAAGTAAPEGVVLVAGTGSIAAAVREREVRRVCGGYGWALGDEGSAVWLGLRAIQAALLAAEGRARATSLSVAIPEALGFGPVDATTMTNRVVAAVHGRPPAALGLIAPVVLEAARTGDAVAGQLVEAACGHLAELALAATDGQGPPVVVLAGSLLTKAEPIRLGVRSRIAARWAGTRFAEAVSGEAGAVALAIARHTGTPLAERSLSRLREEAATRFAA